MERALLIANLLSPALISFVGAYLFFQFGDFVGLFSGDAILIAFFPSLGWLLWLSNIMLIGVFIMQGLASLLAALTLCLIKPT